VLCFLYSNWNSAELSFKLTSHLCITLKPNQFITPVQVYKMKYLLGRQYSKYQFIDFINT